MSQLEPCPAVPLQLLAMANAMWLWFGQQVAGSTSSTTFARTTAATWPMGMLKASAYFVADTIGNLNSVPAYVHTRRNGRSRRWHCQLDGLPAPKGDETTTAGVTSPM
jgi:hypothetical protein